MKTHLDLDGALLEKVQTLGGYATKRQAVDAALRDHARRLAARQLYEMRGAFADDFASVSEPEPPRFPTWER